MRLDYQNQARTHSWGWSQLLHARAGVHV